MKPYFDSGDGVTLHLGDCLDVMREIPEGSIDAVTTDPPYALTELPLRQVVEAMTTWLGGDRAFVPAGPGGFMGTEWDAFVPPPAVWDECLRVLKPGGHLCAFAAPRTQDLMALSIRLAGFEIRDGIAWLFGGGKPAGLDVGKALGGEFEGRHTTLRPAQEPVIVARKPFRGGVADNVVSHGTGALNIDACRIATGDDLARPHGAAAFGLINDDGWMPDPESRSETHPAGRWPANAVFSHAPQCGQIGVRRVRGDSRSGRAPGRRPGGFGDVGADSGSERPNGTLYGDEVVPVFDCVPGCPVAELDRQSGVLTSGVMRAGTAQANRGGYSGPMPAVTGAETHGGSGGASRFFNVFRYQGKAGAAERPRLEDGTGWPTVKPLELMRWLVRLVTPPGGSILDPCCGTGVTGEAAIIEGFRCVLIDRDPVAAELAKVRLSKPLQPALFGAAA